MHNANDRQEKSNVISQVAAQRYAMQDWVTVRGNDDRSEEDSGVGM